MNKSDIPMTPICGNNGTYRLNSPGILVTKSEKYLSYSVPQLELQIGLIIIFTHAIHFFLKRIGITMFSSSMIAGIVLGPTFLGKFDIISLRIFPPESAEPLDTISLIGGYLFLFLSSVKMDVGLVLKAKKRALSIGIGSVVAPLLLGSACKNITNFKNHVELKNLIVNQSLTCFPVIAYVVNQLEITNSELGRLGLASALVADVIGISSLLILHLSKSLTWKRDAVGILVFLLAVSFIFRPIMKRVIRKNPDELPFNSSFVHIVLAFIFASAIYFSAFHQVIYLATYIIGFAVPSGRPLGSAFIDRFEAFTLGVFLPVQVTTLLMRVDLAIVASRLFKVKLRILVVFVMFIAKLLASLIPPLLFSLPFIDAMAVASIMSCKGIVELYLYSRLKDMRGISFEVFAVIVLCILFSSIIAPLVIKFLYEQSRKRKGFRERNVASLKSRSELRILTSIHTPDNIFPVLRLIDTFNPTKENPISVYALHLNELIGCDTPVFITHKKNKPNYDPISQNVIFAFHNFEKDNLNSVSVQIFTAISPGKLMDNDICTLAITEETSLIIVPLHRKWSVHGFIGSENRSLRILNRKVLNKAPCSVGIFYSRSKVGDQSVKASKRPFHSVCVIFIGGDDDREALALAKRMACNPIARLTVVRLLAEDDNATWWEDQVRDNKATEDFKKLVDGESVDYTEVIVKDGPDTAMLVHSMANDYDLFIVGRRYGIPSTQTDGLSGWSELPELGVIGDLLASKDLNSAASILVVQKQKSRSC